MIIALSSDVRSALENRKMALKRISASIDMRDKAAWGKAAASAGERAAMMARIPFKDKEQ